MFLWKEIFDLMLNVKLCTQFQVSIQNSFDTQLLSLSSDLLKDLFQGILIWFEEPEIASKSKQATRWSSKIKPEHFPVISKPDSMMLNMGWIKANKCHF